MYEAYELTQPRQNKISESNGNYLANMNSNRNYGKANRTYNQIKFLENQNYLPI